MQLLKIAIAIFIILRCFLTLASPNIRNNDLVDIQEQYSVCREEIFDKNKLIVNWYMADPYQFAYINKHGNYGIAGLDIELINTISNRVGVNIQYINSSGIKSISNIQNGKSDIVAGATYTDERAEFANFSTPYRVEEISLFVLSSSKKQVNFTTVPELLAQIRALNFRLGIMTGFVYGDIKITNYLNDANNSDIIIKYESNSELFNALIRKEIDGFITDKLTGLALILSYTNEQIEEVPTGIKVPLHLMFSQKTVSKDLVERFNKAIKESINNDDYKALIKRNLYSVLLTKSIGSTWGYIVGCIASIAFAISGIILATQKNATFFLTFILATLPSIFGSVLLDFTINHVYNAPLTFTPTYFYPIFITVLAGFSTLKLLNYYNTTLYEDNFGNKILTNTLIICDTVGQAYFMVVGAIIVIIEKIEPLEFWAPCFAFIISTTGIAIRNLVNSYGQNNQGYISHKINFEISILWSLIFIMLLDIYAYHTSYDTIKYSMITVMAGAIVSRLLILL
ncbi:transporter substrate-binding domain-containing protein [Candidatus Tisiphia endosymbiont of Nemotelus uliginosus]|uniref:transporter substrate-binding domain-containing protein n=1 Tax=Candidatus Tisiphia endosymbiont of Nemotelus uliginosus TaxID=3077926 RepID=UPI0035C8A53F